MAQFDIYANLNPDTQQQVPYLLDVQAELLSHLNTRVVAPLYHKGNISNLLQRLNPTLSIHGETLILSIGELSAVPVTYLGEAVANAHDDREDIIAAIDMLITGV